MRPVHVVGCGLAGSQAAWQLAQACVLAALHEMRSVRGTRTRHTAHVRLADFKAVLGSG